MLLDRLNEVCKARNLSWLLRTCDKNDDRLPNKGYFLHIIDTVGETTEQQGRLSITSQGRSLHKVYSERLDGALMLGLEYLEQRTH